VRVVVVVCRSVDVEGIPNNGGRSLGLVLGTGSCLWRRDWMAKDR
jgi:hypothetical protein